MILRESETIELNEVVSETLKKTIIAFANTHDGTIYIGIDDAGSIVGVKDPDKEIIKITNMVRDNIRPDVSMFIHYETVDMEGKDVIKITVQRGTDRPYYLTSKGMRPEGVFVREGNSSMPSTENAIKQMIKETDGDIYEDMRSLDQDLTFDYLQEEFSKRDIVFDASKMRALNMIDDDGEYTNVAMLLSDQCTFKIKVAVFENDDRSVFKDRGEFSGSLLKQANEAYRFIDFYNKTHSKIDGLYRIDTRDYPRESLREGLLNAVVHKDYSRSVDTIINIYSDHIEIISYGSLCKGLTYEDIMIGGSARRNEHLANIFYRLELIEAYGTGIDKIMTPYKAKVRKPKIELAPNTFKLTLPNINVNDVIEDRNDLKKAIVDHIAKNTKTTRQELEKEFNTSQSTINRILRALIESKVIKKNGSGKNTTYSII